MNSSSAVTDTALLIIYILIVLKAISIIARVKTE
jgi:hypothetical protein